jgi:hypothetical protein
MLSQLSDKRNTKQQTQQIYNNKQGGIISKLKDGIMGSTNPPSSSGGGGGGGLLGMLQDSYARQFNVTVGCDFLACLEHCCVPPLNHDIQQGTTEGEVGGKGCRCFLIDRPVTVTLDRAKSR